MMDRRTFMVAFAGSLLAAPLSLPLAADAQPGTAVRKIGFLLWGDAPAPGPLRYAFLDAFLQGLREFGYVEGQSIAIEERYGRGDRLAILAAELVRLKVDVIVASGTPATLAAKQATQTIPIVMTLVGDPVASGLVASLARPGGNVTGMTMFGSEVFGIGLQLIKEAVPKISRVGALMDPTNPAQVAMHEKLQAAAKALGVKVQPLDVRTDEDLDGALAAALREGTEALLVYPVPLGAQSIGRIAAFAIKHRLPTVATLRLFVDAGGLMSYGTKQLFLDSARRAASYVGKILKGARPADLPVEQPTKFELVINLKTAKALGLVIPQSVLLRADQVIE